MSTSAFWDVPRPVWVTRTLSSSDLSSRLLVLLDRTTIFGPGIWTAGDLRSTDCEPLGTQRAGTEHFSLLSESLRWSPVPLSLDALSMYSPPDTRIIFCLSPLPCFSSLEYEFAAVTLPARKPPLFLYGEVRARDQKSLSLT